MLLADDAQPAAELAFRRRGARVLAYVGDARPGPSETLPRPLRMQDFETWLSRVQQRLASTDPGVSTVPAPQVRYRLRRWPPAELIRSERTRLRMATALTRQALTVAELAKATGVGESECSRFIHVLLGFQLLETAPVARAATAPPPPASWTLLSRIRRRLGFQE